MKDINPEEERRLLTQIVAGLLASGHYTEKCGDGRPQIKPEPVDKTVTNARGEHPRQMSEALNDAVLMLWEIRKEVEDEEDEDCPVYLNGEPDFHVVTNP